ncbi:MAG: hypothetical protein ABH883_03550 [Candidatus Omnitrophota bacterium]
MSIIADALKKAQEERAENLLKKEPVRDIFPARLDPIKKQPAGKVSKLVNAISLVCLICIFSVAGYFLLAPSYRFAGTSDKKIPVKNEPYLKTSAENISVKNMDPVLPPAPKNAAVLNEIIRLKGKSPGKKLYNTSKDLPVPLQLQPATVATIIPSDGTASVKNSTVLTVKTTVPETNELTEKITDKTLSSADESNNTEELPELNGIMYSTDHPQAIVSGSIVFEGSRINNFLIVKIHPDRVIVSVNNEEFELRVRQ